MEYPCNNTYDILFLDVQRIFLDKKKKKNDIPLTFFEHKKFSVAKRQVS